MIIKLGQEWIEFDYFTVTPKDDRRSVLAGTLHNGLGSLFHRCICLLDDFICVVTDQGSNSGVR